MSVVNLNQSLIVANSKDSSKMAANYKLFEKDGLFSIIETKTEHIIKKFDNKEIARQFMRSLNFGSGFDGWTPQFMIIKFNEKKKK